MLKLFKLGDDVLGILVVETKFSVLRSGRVLFLDGIHEWWVEFCRG